MSQWRRYVVLGVAAYLGWLAAFIPADLALPPLAQRLPGVTLRGISGTLWSGGAASLELAGYPLQNLSWAWRPGALWHGRLELELGLADRQTQGHARIGVTLGGSAYVRELRAALPAALVSTTARLDPVQLGGTVTANVAELLIDGARVRTASGELRWRSASIRGPQVLELGGYAVRLQVGPKGELAGVVGGLGGPLQAGGELSLTLAGQYRINLRLVATSTSDEALRQGLELIGRPEPDGSIRVALSGQLS